MPRKAVRPVRIVTVSHGYGTDERMKLLEMIAFDHEVILVAPRRIWTQVFGNFDAPRSDRVEVLANRTIPFGRSGHFLFRPSFAQYRRLRPSILQVEYEPWTPEFWSFVLPMMILYPRTPLVLYVRKNTRHLPRGPLGVLERFLTRVGMIKVKRILAVSEKAASVFVNLGYGNTPMEIQGHMPIDGDVFRPQIADSGPRPVTVGYVGSIAPHKGIRTLVEATEKARGRLDADIRLSLVGPMRDRDLERLLASHHWIDYKGPLENSELPSFLSSLDVFVMPSLVLPDHEEHDSLALLEAMAVGVACIGSRSGNMPEIIQEGENGWMFPPDDSEALANLLQRLLDDPEARRRAGASARVTALAFTGLQTLAKQRVSTYEAVANG